MPEYLAVGPELLEEWRRARRPTAHPRGHLLVRAAIDFARSGPGEVPREALRTAQPLYRRELVAARAEPFDDGLGWSAHIRHGVTGLLTPGGRQDSWAVLGSPVADVGDRPESPPVPLGMWTLALRAAPEEAARWTVRRNAHLTLVPLADGDPGTAVVLGRINATLGDIETAAFWYRKGADAGHIGATASLGEPLVLLDAEAEAVPYLEAAGAGHPAAAEALTALRAVTATPPDTVKE
ncbi:hypothetical protein [Streptomyces sp. NPDC018055]|uniref:hypothetical protein n=1 Tax=Streptomyces sp. NPDC018055 TaxID=3365038 RepID=UPI00378C17BC